MKDYDTTEAVQDTSSRPLARGEYPLLVEKTETDLTKNGIPRVRLQLRSTHGPVGVKNRVVFDDIYLGASRTKRDGDNDVVRTPEEYEKARKGAVGRAKGLLK